MTKTTQKTRIIQADCVEALAELDEASVDAIVTDPPYGLEFMGKEWDRLEGGEDVRQPFRGEVQTPDNPYGRTPVRYPYNAQGKLSQDWHQAWATQAFRVLKPGGHLLAFGGTRTYHRLACAVEDAGFEIRDSLIWLYGSGFPKSLDVSKAIDRMDDARRPEREAVGRWLRDQREARGLKQKEVAAHWPSVTGGLTGCVANWEGGFGCPTLDQWADLKRIIGLPDDMDAEVWRLNGRKGQPGENWEKREKVGERDGIVRPGFAGDTYGPPGGGDRVVVDVTAPATPQAQQWQGWGTALKPSHEPIVVARKPLVGTVAANVLEHGTGALNVDRCRVGTDDNLDGGAYAKGGTPRDDGWGMQRGQAGDYEQPAGRWPANVTLSHLPECERVGVRRVKVGDPDRFAKTDGGSFVAFRDRPPRSNLGEDGTEQVPAYSCAPGCPVAELDRQSGEAGGGFGIRGDGPIDGRTSYALSGNREEVGYGDTGGASRFFYCAKSSRGERNAGLRPSSADRPVFGDDGDTYRGLSNSIQPQQNVHPTVKPIDLMRWLVRLVTPPGGLVCDPFAGSGTTGIAAHLEGFDFIGIEREAEYAEIARARIEWWSRLPPGTEVDQALGYSARESVHREAGQDSLFG